MTRCERVITSAVGYFFGNLSWTLLSKGDKKMNDKELREKVRVMKALGYIKNYYEVATKI
jgi:hypothetical protein